MIHYLAALNLVDPSKVGLPQANDNLVGILLTDTFMIIGALAFLMVVISGVRYIVARGNPEAMTKARNSITYSLIGLVIAALAATVVNFVISRASA